MVDCNMLENYKVRAIDLFPENALTGRRKIKTCVSAITEANVRDVVNEALPKQMANAGEITYLWDYYRGKQDIRKKEKFYRKNINNKVTVNRANEIVTFKTSFLLNGKISYVSNGNGKSDAIAKLNEFMRAEHKGIHDKKIVDWMHICGVGERLVLTDGMAGVKNGAPFYLYTLDPREAFVIYSAGVGEKPMAGVVIRYDDDGKMFTEVWTENRKYTVTDDSVTFEAHSLGGIPLIEYENNMARMGAFEPVISILNAINQLESDAVDSVQDFVNGFDVFKNCDIEEGDYQDLAVGGKAVKIRTVVQGMEADVYRVSSELNQSGAQQRIDNLTEEYLTICGMPNRNGGLSTSDTGTAVMYRDGFVDAESRAMDTETSMEPSENQFLQIVLNICKAQTDDQMTLGNLELKDIGIDFARKNLNNLQSRFQCLMEGLNSNKIHPELLFNAFGDMFGDKANAYKMSQAYQEEVERKQQEQLEQELDNERKRISNGGTSTTVQTGGQVDKAPDRENE